MPAGLGWAGLDKLSVPLPSLPAAGPAAAAAPAAVLSSPPRFSAAVRKSMGARVHAYKPTLQHSGIEKMTIQFTGHK
jgi:hypothetical protein